MQQQQHRRRVVGRYVNHISSTAARYALCTAILPSVCKPNLQPMRVTVAENWLSRGQGPTSIAQTCLPGARGDTVHQPENLFAVLHLRQKKLASLSMCPVELFPDLPRHEQALSSCNGTLQSCSDGH